MVMDGCKGLNASFAECLGDDTCPDCMPFSDGIEPLLSNGHDEEQGSTASTATSDSTDTASTAASGSTTQSNSTSTEPAGTEGTQTAPTGSDAATSTLAPEVTTAGSTDSTTTASGGSTTQSASASTTASAGSTTPSETASTTASAGSTTPSETASTTASSGSTTQSASASTTASAGSTTQSASASTTASAGSTTQSASASTQTASTAASGTTTIVADTTSESSSKCPDGLNPVEGMEGCCLPEVAYLGDGACDPDAPYNTPECHFDNGDCCQETCNMDTNYACSSNEASQGFGPFGFFCLNPELEEYIDPDECTVADRTRLGDGRCDDDYNTKECNWDGGDCCEETCDPTYAYFECGAPENPYDCKDETFSTATTTSTSLPETSSVTTIESATTTVDIGSSSATSTIGSSTTSTVNAPEDPTLKVTVVATQMATIYKNDPDTPHGGDGKLQVQGTSFGPNAQDVLLGFIIPASESDPISATIRVYVTSDSASGGIFHVVPESTSSWSDDTVTWNNAPDYTTRLGQLNRVEKDKWYEVDITSAIENLDRKRGPMAVRIRSRNPGTVDYSSRKNGHPPEVLISYPLQPEVSYDAPSVDVADLSSAAGFVEPSSLPKQEYTTSNIINIASNEMYISADEYLNNGDGSYYYPVWNENGEPFCTTGEPPSWASGPYLKKTKKQCCDSYFMLKKNECMSAR
jgi:hypothetical protein